MRFHQDPFATTVSARVLSRTPVGEAWDLLLDDTVLYPEGGGQPDDLGTVDGHPVLALRKDPGGIVHRVGAPLEGTVTVALDWPRRFDHMQQHSGQHLLSAVAQDHFGLPTTAFHLGAAGPGGRSDIEVDGEVDAATVAALEEAVNALIREDRPMRVRSVEVEALAALPVRTRGLPEGFSGSVRLVEIEGIDLNPCGGTHVERTGQLQALKLLSVERLKRGTRLHFVVGGRVLGWLGETVAREAAMTRLLTTAPGEHLSAVGRLLDDNRGMGKALKSVTAELAGAIGAGLSPEEAADGPLVRFHRDDADLGFLGSVFEGVRRRLPEALCVLTGGTREGVFLVAGPEGRVAAWGPRVATTLEGRGGGAKGRFQGKAGRVDRRGEL